MQNSLIREVLTDFLSLFYPRYCLGCADSLMKGEDIVCTRCMIEIPQTHYHTDPDNALKQRLAGRIPLKHAMALFRFSKNGRIQHLLHALKYRNHPEIGVALGRVYGEKLKINFITEFDLIVPVPLHLSRKRKRGYNQSAKFAEGLSEKLAVPFTDEAMVRATRTDTQTRKTKLKRWANVSEVFVPKAADVIHGKRILLVDDVITTGATLEACGTTLMENGCRELSIACIAEA